MPHFPLPPGRAGGAILFSWCRRGFALLGLLLASGAGAFSQAVPPARGPQPAVAVAGRTTVQFAKGSAIEYRGNCKVVAIQNSFGERAAAVRYLLVPRGAARPAGYPGALVIATPLRCLVRLLSLHVALADFLGADDVLVSVGDFKYVSAPRVRRRIAAGQVYEAGQRESRNNELLVARRPDLVMASGWPGRGLGHFPALAAAGIPVLPTS